MICENRGGNKACIINGNRVKLFIGSVKYIEENGYISNKEAREILGLADSTTKRWLKKIF